MKPIDIVNRYTMIKQTKKNILSEEIIQSFFDYVSIDPSIQNLSSRQIQNIIEFFMDLPNEYLHKHLLIQSNERIRNLHLKVLTSSRYADKWNKLNNFI